MSKKQQTTPDQPPPASDSEPQPNPSAVVPFAVPAGDEDRSGEVVTAERTLLTQGYRFAATRAGRAPVETNSEAYARQLGAEGYAVEDRAAPTAWSVPAE